MKGLEVKLRRQCQDQDAGVTGKGEGQKTFRAVKILCDFTAVDPRTVVCPNPPRVASQSAVDSG